MDDTKRADFRSLPAGPGATEGRLFEVSPAPPSAGFLATTALLGALFGLPALAVLLNSGRRDAMSLSAAACGLLILGFAGYACWRALVGRGRQRILVTMAGIGRPGQMQSWCDVIALEVLTPRPSRYTPARLGLAGDAVGGSQSLGARIGQQQQAGTAKLIARVFGRAGPVVLAEGLDEPTASRLLEALVAAARGAGYPVPAVSLNVPPGPASGAGS